MLLKHASTPYLNIKFHSNFGSKQFNLSLLIQYHHLIHHSSSDNQMKLRCFSAFQWRATSASIWSISLRLLLNIHSKMLLEVPQIRCWYFHFGDTQRHKRGRKTRKNRSSSQRFDYRQVYFHSREHFLSMDFIIGISQQKVHKSFNPSFFIRQPDEVRIEAFCRINQVPKNMISHICKDIE